MAGSTSQFDSDGDVVMQTTSQPVFEFIQAPRLDNWGHDALVKWKLARDQYEETVQQRCLESRERPEVAIKPIKPTFSPKLLEVVCHYELRKSVDAVTNEELLTLITQRIGTVKNEVIPDIDELFKKNLKIDLKEDDIDARVLKYYREVSTIIENQGLTKLLAVGDPEAEGFADRMKLRCTILIDNLEPRMVRDDVNRYCKYECREAKRNDFLLFNIIKEKAKAQHKYHMMSLEQKPKQPSTRKPNSNDLKNTTGRSNNRVAMTPRDDPPRNSSAQSQRKEIKPPKTGCWHCQGIHWLKDCPTASSEDRDRAVEKCVRSKTERVQNR